MGTYFPQEKIPSAEYFPEYTVVVLNIQTKKNNIFLRKYFVHANSELIIFCVNNCSNIMAIMHYWFHKYYASLMLIAPQTLKNKGGLRFFF